MDNNHLPPAGSITMHDGSHAQIVTLKPPHAFMIASLHHKIIAGLDDGEKAYMLEKSAHHFAQHIRKGDGNVILGVMHHGKLAAQALILHPTAKHPATGMVDMAPVAAPENLSILQAVSVKPEYRGQGLMDALLIHWTHHAAAHGRTDMLAEIHVKNVASWHNLMQAGLNLVSIGQDPTDAVLVYNSHEKTAAAKMKALSPTFNHYAGKTQTICALDDLQKQKTLMQQGYAATAHDKKGKTLLMTLIKG